ncbi:uncharacterized protein LOC135819148 [Sycon ciliatum]|uniref:uncharacterized protein LOC135819148 n=1 Tax=Sycon ciliatum TaxID=27933 RepID=UPI0020AD57E5|eukprot:scpid86516/ scgid19284/ 
MEQSVLAAMRPVLAILVLALCTLSTGAMADTCTWDLEERKLTCPQAIINQPAAGLAALVNYTRCCSLETPPYIEAFVLGGNLGTPACCVERLPTYTSLANTPPALEARLQGAAVNDSQGPTQGYVQLTGAVLLTDAVDTGDSGLEAVEIAGIVVTCIGGLILLLIIIYVFVTLSRSKDSDDRPQSQKEKEAEADGRGSPYAKRKSKSRTNLVCFSSTAV